VPRPALSSRRATGLAAFLSGAAALLFETLWFRQTSLSFGNSVSAASLVLAAFMAGLGLGSALAAWRGRGLRDPARAYAALEIVIAASGLALVLLIPRLGPLLAPVLRPLLDHPLALGAARFGLSGLLLALPATAMGATLPLLVKASLEAEAGFGVALGRLYGWNTLGAVLGALAGEGMLIGSLGLRGTGVVAAALNAGAALVVMLAMTDRATVATVENGVAPARRRPGWRLLAAAALCGGILLGLEVLWFRFLLLFAHGTSVAFAVMLAVILAGIALGGFAASRLLERLSDAHRFLPALACATAATTVATYALFRHVTERAPAYAADVGVVALLSLPLMLPVSFASGVLFTLLGRALQEQTGEAASTAGLLTLANTLGAVAGSVLASLLLLPVLGLERSFFGLAVAYLATAFVLWPLALPSRGRAVTTGAALVSVGALAFFPFGLMERRYLGRVVERFSADGSRLIAREEARTETILYFRRDFLGQPLSHRLVTNGYSMSGTEWGSRRYMALFAHLPLALQERPRRALLLCYGVGSTARSLTAHRELERIDVVDISREILDLSRLTTATGAPQPLDDPRVRVHVEDGRFYLQTTRDRFDLITGEPPPPKYAGVVNLYTREYFTLVRDRLSDGGLASYWLPIWLLEVEDGRSIVRAFCEAFADCTLWTGAGLNWTLVGSRTGVRPVTESGLRRSWADPVVGEELATLGIETPAALGATFLGDSMFLAEWAAGSPPLEDNHPARLSSRIATAATPETAVLEVTDARLSRERFERSDWLRRVWPATLRAETLAAFDAQDALNRALVRDERPWYLKLDEVRQASTSTLAPLLLLGSTPDEQRLAAAAAAQSPTASPVLYQLALRDLARGGPELAEPRLAEVQKRNPAIERIVQLRALALCYAGRSTEAASLGVPLLSGASADRAFWEWLRDRCRPPSSAPS
jgi:spermidine synthase